MKPYTGEYSPYQHDSHSKPSKVWRKKYPCKINKGEHTFELIKPHYFDNIKEFKGMTVSQYYVYEYKRKEELKKNGNDFFSDVLYYLKCSSCGKHDYMMERDSKSKKKLPLWRAIVRHLGDNMRNIE